MKTKIVYVLVSGKNDFYLEQTLISVYSCRLHNREANITIVLDSDTSKSLKGSRAEIKKYATELIVAEIPSEYNNMQKSRYLKTSLRSIVEGDFLYIDSDTVIADDLSEIDGIEANLAAVFDSNRCLPISDTGYTSDGYINYNTGKLGWPSVIGSYNFNGGVILARSCSLAREFFNRWHELWKESVSKGLNIDMPALCRTNNEMGGCIQTLDGIWNCQIQRQGLPLLPCAKIIHCFTGGNVTFYELCSEKVLQKIKHTGLIDDETKELILNARTAFSKETAIVATEDVWALNRPVNKLRYYSPFSFKVLNKLASIILRIKHIS